MGAEEIPAAGVTLKQAVQIGVVVTGLDRATRLLITPEKLGFHLLIDPRTILPNKTASTAGKYASRECLGSPRSSGTGAALSTANNQGGTSPGKGGGS